MKMQLVTFLSYLKDIIIITLKIKNKILEILYFHEINSFKKCNLMKGFVAYLKIYYTNNF